MGKDYRVMLYTIDTEDGKEWVAEYPDLKGCVGGGNTLQEALAEAEENKEIYLQDILDDGGILPMPSNPYDSNYSGKFTVRISKTLHRKLSETAEEEGVSINQIVCEAIAQRITGYAKKLDKRVESVENKLILAMADQQKYDNQDEYIVPLLDKIGEQKGYGHLQIMKGARQ